MEDMRIDHLSEDEKLQLIERLWISLNKERDTLTDAQKQELEKRLVKYEAGGTLRTWKEVRERIGKNR